MVCCQQLIDAMKTVAVVLTGLLLAGSVFADPYTIAKQRARGVADQNNANQQRIQRGAGENQPVDPALQSTMQNIADLAADFTAFGKSEKVGAEQKASLMNNLTGAAQGKKAKSDTVHKLADDLATALTGKKISAAQAKQLGGFTHAVFNASHLATAQLDKLTASAEKLLTELGVSPEAATSVIGSLKAVAEQTK
jgi:hypothetical protein